MHASFGKTRASGHAKTCRHGADDKSYLRIKLFDEKPLSKLSKRLGLELAPPPELPPPSESDPGDDHDDGDLNMSVEDDFPPLGETTGVRPAKQEKPPADSAPPPPKPEHSDKD